MTYATAAEKFDQEVVDKGVRVFIEPRALLKITGTVMDELERTGGRYGLVTLCIGGGMGIATIIERV